MNTRHPHASYLITTLIGIAPCMTGCSPALTDRAIQDVARAYVQAEFNQPYTRAGTTGIAPAQKILTAPPFRQDLQALSYYAGRACALSLFGRSR